VLGCNPNAVELILGSIGGIAAVKFLTDYIKNQLGAKGFWAYLISLGICGSASALFIVLVGDPFVFKCFLSYTGILFAMANGFYRMIPKKEKK
jgi:hypothetical protein